MILESYKHFNAEEFVKSLKTLRKTRRKLVEELDAVSELPAIDNKTGIRSSTISDLTARQAIRRAEIESEIAEIDVCLSAYDYAKNKLPEGEKEVIELFFESKEPIWRGVERYTTKHYVCRDKVYRTRRIALANLGTIISNKFLK